MNFNLIVSIFALAITEINLVRAEGWKTSRAPIRINFGIFIEVYEKACLAQNPQLFSDRHDKPSGDWYYKTEPENLELGNFITITEETINLLTSNFKPLKTADGVSAIRTAMQKLCDQINKNQYIDDTFKYGGIPLRDFLRNDLYIEGLGETGENFDTDCPLQ